MASDAQGVISEHGGKAESMASRGISATLRREKGGDIDAACGQLRLRTERELNGNETFDTRLTVRT